MDASPSVAVKGATVPCSCREHQATLHAENDGERSVVMPGSIDHARHPHREAAINEASLPGDAAPEMTMVADGSARARAEPSDVVAPIGALDARSPGRMTPRDVADAARRVETQRRAIRARTRADALSACADGIAGDLLDSPIGTASSADRLISEPWTFRPSLPAPFYECLLTVRRIHDADQ
jgi:D-glycero-alpha-D-manno-heptose-7-phosphate kinase